MNTKSLFWNHIAPYCCVDLSSDDEGEMSTTVSGTMESDDESSES